MGLKLTFAMSFVSDYHAGTGESRGALLDAVIARSPNGAPEIRGRTLIGLLRQSLFDLLQTEALQGLRGCKASGLSTGESFCAPQLKRECPLCQVFGSPARAKDWHASAARPAGATAERGWENGVAAGIISNVRRDPQTRRAEAHKLYTREEGDGRLLFTFALSWPQATAATLEQAAWLVAAARHLRHLGKRRRRGVGEVRVHLQGCALTDTVPETTLDEAWFLAHWQQACLNRHVEGHDADPLRLTTQRAEPDQPWVAPDETMPWVHLIAIVRLDEATLVATGNEVGFTLDSLGYIPGTALQGIACERAAALGHLAPGSPNYATAARLLLDGGVRFGALYPAKLWDDKITLFPTLPAPRDQYECELHPGRGNASHPHPAFATIPLTESLPHACGHRESVERETCAGRLRPQSGYLTLEVSPHEHEAALVVSRHPGIDPRLSRVRSGVLYSFRALAARQYFVGEVTCSDGAALAYLQAIGLTLDTAHEVWVGRGTQGGHGQALLHLSQRAPKCEHPLLCGAPLDKRLSGITKPFTLTLLSDAIVRDRWGRAVTSLDEAFVRETLSLPGKVIRSYSASRAVDGFNAYLGLPRWRDLALRAGSVVGIQLDEGSCQKTVMTLLKVLEKQGIGLRRSEGFGQIAFNHPVYGTTENWDVGTVSPPAALRYPRQAGETVPALAEARFIKEWQRALDSALDGLPPQALSNRNWEAALRVLRLQPLPTTPDEARALLASMEQPQAPLPEEAITALDVHTRSKAGNRYLTGKGQNDAVIIAGLLADLCTKASRFPRLWQLGLDLLADAIGLRIKKMEEA